MEQDQEPNHEPRTMAQLWAEGLREATESRKHPIIPPPAFLATSGQRSAQRGSLDSGFQVTRVSSTQSSQRNSNGSKLTTRHDADIQQVRRRLGKEVGQLSPTSSAVVTPSSSSSSSPSSGSTNGQEKNGHDNSGQHLQALSKMTSPKITTIERRGESLPNAILYNYLADLDIPSCKEALSTNGSTTEEEVQRYRVDYDGSASYKAGSSIDRMWHSRESEPFETALDEDDWELSTLLNLTDTMRVATSRLQFHVKELKQVSAILWRMLVDESSPKHRVSLDLIVYTRLDKLIAEIMEEGKKSDLKDDLRVEILARATSLQHKWFLRFKDDIFGIDKRRMAVLQDSGHLHDVHLTQGERKDRQRWAVNNETQTTPEIEGEQNFKVGDWWINMVCAYRDGIVSNPLDTITGSSYGAVALALLSGIEEDGSREGLYQYTKEGSQQQINRLMGLALNRGQPIRILRGYMLNSKYAPEAGVRYDGLYKVTSFARLPHDEAEGDRYTCRIILERSIGGQEMEELLQIPTPSQLDDWALYNRIIGEDVRKRDGDVKYSDWMSWQDKVDRVHEHASDERSMQDELQKLSLGSSTGIDQAVETREVE